MVGALTDQPDTDHARNCWKVLKFRLKKEGNESVTNCNQLKLRSSDGKRYKTYVADTEQLFRIIQFVPSSKAEPIKQWMAHVAAERIDQLQDHELCIQQAMMDYKRLGYSDNRINQRLKSIEILKVWLNQSQISNLLGTSVQNVSCRFINILEDKELYADSVIKDYLITAYDGTNILLLYN